MRPLIARSGVRRQPFPAAADDGRGDDPPQLGEPSAAQQARVGRMSPGSRACGSEPSPIPWTRDCGVLQRMRTCGTSVVLSRIPRCLARGPSGVSTAIAARAHALAAGRMTSWPLLEDPQASGHARRRIRQQLQVWDLDELTMTAEAIASELVENVVRHAQGTVRLRLLRSTSLIREVSDGSQTTPRIRRAADTHEGCRGLQLITTLPQRCSMRYTAAAKCVWTQRRFPVTRTVRRCTPRTCWASPNSEPDPASASACHCFLHRREGCLPRQEQVPSRGCTTRRRRRPPRRPLKLAVSTHR